MNQTHGPPREPIAEGDQQPTEDDQQPTRRFLVLLAMVVGGITLLAVAGSRLLTFSSGHREWLFIPFAAGLMVASLNLVTHLAIVIRDAILCRGGNDWRDMDRRPVPWESLWDWQAPGISIVVLFLAKAWLGHLGDPGRIAFMFFLFGIVVPALFATALGFLERHLIFKTTLQIILYVLVLMLGYFLPTIIDNWCDGTVTADGCQPIFEKEHG